MAGNLTTGNLFESYIRGRITRGQMLKAAGIGLAAAAVPEVASAAGSGQSFPYFPQVQGTYTTEQVQNILNVAVTVEHLAVTVLNAALTTYASSLQLNDLGKVLVQSTLARDQAHIDFLTSLGGVPVTTSFTIPPFIFQDAITFFTGGEAIETLETGGYMTAAREFAELGQPTLAKNAYQIGAVEAEGRALIRGALLLLGAPGATPPGNKAFETDLVLYTKDELGLVETLGFIGGPFPPVSYPGRDTALATAGSAGAAIIQKIPNNATSTVTFTGLGSLLAERT